VLRSDSICIFPAQRAQNWIMPARRKHDRIELSRDLEDDVFNRRDASGRPAPLKKYGRS